ncbi:MAG: hypothetical protein QM764_11985 [Chitinophagaceae bacterium]
MSQYVFSTDQFGIDDSGIHLLRSGYNYQTIEFDSISSIAIEKGYQVNNRFIVIMAGILLTLFGIFAAVKIIYEFFILNSARTYYIEEFVVPVLPLAFGVFALLYSFRKGLVLRFQFDNKIKRLFLGRKENTEKLSVLKQYLLDSNNTRQKFKFANSEDLT